MRQNHAKNAHQMNVLAHVARDRNRPTRGLCARSANAAIMTQHELPVSPTFAARLAATRGSGGSCTCREARRAAHRLVALAESVLRPASRRVGEYASILSLCTSHPVLIAEEPCGHGGGPASGVSSARACHERVLPTQAGRSYERGRWQRMGRASEPWERQGSPCRRSAYAGGSCRTRPTPPRG